MTDNTEITMTFSFLQVLSLVFGWIYTISWSLSFYPQAILNYRRKSTSGMTIDFALVNVLGFFSYLTSNSAFLFSPTIRGQYAARHHGLTPTVQYNDIAFAGHAAILTLITLSQFYPSIWGFDRLGKKGPGAKISKGILGFCVGAILSVCIVTFIVSLNPTADPQTSWAWIDVIYTLSYVKACTLIKYVPQVMVNYQNRSTQGWSIFTILFDILGGVLSLSQLFIDSYLQHDWSGITGNPVKFFLGNVTIFFDVIFIIQHYFLYSKKGAGNREEEDPLLNRQRERID